MKKDFRKIVSDISRNRYLNRGNVCYRASENGVVCRMECSEFSPEELKDKHVVYYMSVGDKHYFGYTNNFDRRMSEHLRKDDNLFRHYKHKKEFIVKPIMVCDNISDAKRYEREIISFAKYVIKDENLINII